MNQKITRKKYSFTEEQMADAFERRLLSRQPLDRIGRVNRVFREVDCHRGRPDFIGIISRMHSHSPIQHTPHNVATACVLSLLKSNSPRSLQSLTRSSHLTREVIAQSVRHLVTCGLVDETGTDLFTLSGGAAIFGIESIAFELKLTSPRRAVFQAQQYTLFAQQAWIVVPPPSVQGYDLYRPVLSRWGIGLATFDPKSHVFRTKLPAKRRPPISRQHQAYAMLRLVGNTAA